MAKAKSGKKEKKSKSQTKSTKVKSVSKGTIKAKTKTTGKVKPKTKSKLTAKPKLMPKVKTVMTGKNKSSRSKGHKGSENQKVADMVLPLVPRKKLGPEELSSLEGLFTPLDNRILAVVDIEEQKTTGGLFIPEVAQTKPFTATVIAHGPGHRNKKGKLRPVAVQKGDRILFDKYGGQKMQMENHDVVILREDEVIGVLTD